MSTDLLIRVSETISSLARAACCCVPSSLPVRVARRRNKYKPISPTLSLAQVHGAIVYYLEHQGELDARFAEEDHALDEAHAENRAANTDFFGSMRARLEAGKSQNGRNSHSSEPPQA
jgi:hypothetical protein